jgi:hypothetical protein
MSKRPEFWVLVVEAMISFLEFFFMLFLLNSN